MAYLGIGAAGSLAGVAKGIGLLGAAGGTAGAIEGGLSTYAANPNAGALSYTVGIGLGGGFGILNPFGAFGGLGGGIAGGSVELAAGGDFLGTGFLAGSFAGGVAGGGVNVAVRNASNLRHFGKGAHSLGTIVRSSAVKGLRSATPELIGAGVGGAIGYSRTGTLEGTLFGAQIGTFSSSIALYAARPSVIFQRLTSRANRELARHGMLVQETITPNQFVRALDNFNSGNPTFARMMYGNVVEQSLVAGYVAESRILSRFFGHVGRSRGANGQFIESVDFVGKSVFRGINIDITSAYQISTKFGKSYGPGLIVTTYTPPF